MARHFHHHHHGGGLIGNLIGDAVAHAAETAAETAVNAISDSIKESARAKREDERIKREYEFKQKQAEAELEWKKQEAYYNNMAGGAASNETVYHEFKVDGKVTPDGSIHMTTTKTKFYETCPHCYAANTGKPVCDFCGASLVENLDITRTKTDGNN